MSKIDQRGDMGPFADMDPALISAISRYGTPPYREMVRVEVRNVGSYEFDEMPTTFDGWVGWLSEAKEAAPSEYRDELSFVLKFENGSYDSGDTADFRVWYDRPETDEEMIARVSRGIAYVQGSEAKERAEFERLKAKFGA